MDNLIHATYPWADDRRMRPENPMAYDTPRQIAYCLSCKRDDCYNCLGQLRCGEIPEDAVDPCLKCYTRDKCRSGSCAAKTAWRARNVRKH